MTKSEELLFKRFKVDLKSKPEFNKNYSKVLVKNNDSLKNSIVVDQLVDTKKIPFIDPEIVNEEFNGWYKIILKIDETGFLRTLKQMYKFGQKRELYNLLESCHNECILNYKNLLTLSFFEGILSDKKPYLETQIPKSFKSIEEESLKWYIYRENSASAKLHFYDYSTIKLFSKYVDIKNKRIKAEADKSYIHLKGGVVLDPTDYYWIKEFIIASSYMKNVSPENCSKHYLKSKSTLIICTNDTVNIWINHINVIGKKMVVIDTKVQHNKVLYQDLLDTDYTIFCLEYLKSKSYQNIFSDYIFDDYTSFTKVFNHILEDNRSNTTIQTDNLPLITSIYWNRLVLDSSSYTQFTTNTYFKDLVNSVDSSFRWMQTHELTTCKDDYKLYLNYLSNGSDISYPIYNKDDTVYLTKSIVRKVKSNASTDINIKKKFEFVEMDSTVSQVNSFVKQHKYRDLDKMVDIKDQMFANSFKESEIKNHLISTLDTQINKIKKQIQKLEDLENRKKYIENSFKLGSKCTICHTKPDNTVVTSCGHTFCLECTLNNTVFSNQCAICRSPLKLDDIHPISKPKARLNRKYSKALKDIKNLSQSSKVLVYVKNFTAMGNLSSMFRGSKVKPWHYQGSNSRRRNLVQKFNSSDRGIMLVRLEDHEASKSIMGVEHCLFLDVSTEVLRDPKPYLGGSYMARRIQQISINYYIYKNSLEEELLKTLNIKLTSFNYGN